jgi:hypothetical protein
LGDLSDACGRWVAIEGVKAVEVNVKEIFWWRHAQRCHGSSRIVGDVDIVRPFSRRCTGTGERTK